MKIKEVEERVGMKRANIRYYEKEGLLKSPERNSENNYREYSEADVVQLQKIKVLRILGVTPDDIKLLSSEKVSMEEVIAKRTQQLQKEIKESQGLLEICQIIIERDIDIQTLNEDVLSVDKKAWWTAFEEILERDIVKEVITRKQLNRTMTGMLLWGYFISMVTTVLILFYEKNAGITSVGLEDGAINLWAALGVLVGSVICECSVYFTASVKIHTVLYHISSILLAPFILMVVRLVAMIKGTNPLNQFSMIESGVFWILLMVYVAVLYLLSTKWEKMFTKLRYTLVISGGFSIAYASIIYMAGSCWMVPAIVMTFLIFHIGINWTITNTDRQTYNRYYIVKEAGRIMNMFGMLFGMQGRGSMGAWLK